MGNFMVLNSYFHWMATWLFCCMVVYIPAAIQCLYRSHQGSMRIPAQDSKVTTHMCWEHDCNETLVWITLYTPLLYQPTRRHSKILFFWEKIKFDSLHVTLPAGHSDEVSGLFSQKKIIKKKFQSVVYCCCVWWSLSKKLLNQDSGTNYTFWYCSYYVCQMNSFLISPWKPCLGMLLALVMLNKLRLIN